jgi:acyl-CoA thioesterase-2
VATTETPKLLALEEVADHRYRVTMAEEQEGRDVVFGGQLLSQMIMASDTAAGGAKDIKSMHTIFARAGSYQASPIELQVESMQSGRTWASDTVTAWQDDRLLARSLVLMSIDDPDLMRHDIDMPSVPAPQDVEPIKGLVMPGAEMRKVLPITTINAVPEMYYWHTFPVSSESPAVNQAILAYATNGFFIELAMQAHPDSVNIHEAHRTISTGVMGHTVNFHERFDVGQWLLLAHDAAYAGRGRIHGRGLVFTEDGGLVATFTQDSMARRVEAPLDASRAM